MKTLFSQPSVMIFDIVKYICFKQEDSSQLQHLLTALDSGCPPHGGIALGKTYLFYKLYDVYVILNNYHL